jgi:DnaJ-class molecular chaperone
MFAACLRCEGSGVVRHYINRAGDYEKYHCPQCKGSGRGEYAELQLKEEVAKKLQAAYEQRRAEAKAARVLDPPWWLRLMAKVR